MYMASPDIVENETLSVSKNPSSGYDNSKYQGLKPMKNNDTDLKDHSLDGMPLLTSKQLTIKEKAEFDKIVYAYNAKQSINSTLENEDQIISALNETIIEKEYITADIEDQKFNVEKVKRRNLTFKSQVNESASTISALQEKQASVQQKKQLAQENLNKEKLNSQKIFGEADKIKTVLTKYSKELSELKTYTNEFSAYNESEKQKNEKLKRMLQILMDLKRHGQMVDIHDIKPFREKNGRFYAENDNFDGDEADDQVEREPKTKMSLNKFLAIMEAIKNEKDVNKLQMG